MRIAFTTLGCKVNHYETEAMRELFQQAGWDVVPFASPAEVYVVNTCTVTQVSDKKSRQLLSQAHRRAPEALVVATGCYAQTEAEKVASLPGVGLVLGTDGRREIVARVAQALSERGCSAPDVPNARGIERFEELSAIADTRTRATLKIQDGCNNFCSYCLIPYVRGRSRSRALDKVVEEVRSVPENIKEIVLTGIDISSYGKDIGLSLKDLILALSDVDKRIRLGSFEMNIIDDNLLNALKGLKHFCPHFHLSLQSGSDEVLRTMNRHYKTKDYLERVRLIRKYFPLAGITTDVIVGFPTETDEEFLISKEFVKSVGFSDVHCFPYSPRKGTASYKKYKPLDSSVIDGRMKEMLEIKENLKKDFLLKNVGATHEVLFEEYENGYCAGYSENYIRFYDKTAKPDEIRKITGKAQIFDGLM